MMNPYTASAVALGVGYMNAAYLGVPGWVNIIAMGALAIIGQLKGV